MNWRLLLNSLVVSGLASLGALCLGVLAALCLAGLPRRWRAPLMAVGVAALALPPFLVVDCWLQLLGNAGRWRSWLPFNVYSLGGAVWVLALLLWPLSMLAALGAWQALEPAMLDSDPALRGTPLLRWLLLPMARAALEQATLLAFVLALNNFAVPAILQVKVFPAELWVRFNTTFDTLGALLASVPLIAAPLALLAWMRRQEVAWPRWDGGPASEALRRQLGRGWVGASTAAFAGLAVVSLALPLGGLLSTPAAWTQAPAAVAAGRGALANSLGVASAAATLTVVLGLAAWRLPLGAWVWLPLLTPGVVLGVALTELFNRPAFGRLYPGMGLVVAALVLRYLAVGWWAARLARGAVDRDQQDAARVSGATGWGLLRHALWPQMAPRLGVAWYAVYLLCLWDVETLVLIWPPGGETLALRIFNLLHYGHNPQVAALCLALLGVAALPLAVWSAWAKWPALRRARRLAAAGIGAGLPLLLAGCSAGPPAGETLESRLFSRAEVLGSRGTAPGLFNKPRSLALDAQDNLYVVDLTGRVQKFGPDGNYSLCWQMPETDLGKPKGMGMDGQGRIVTIEPHYGRVNHFLPGGALAAQWGVRGTNAGQLFFPRAVAANSRGELWISEYGAVERIQKFAPGGTKLLATLGTAGEGPGEFNRAEGLGVDRADRLLVADSCNHRVQVFSPEGRWLAAFGKAGAGKGELSYPYDVRVDASGCIFVCEFGNSRIQIFDAHYRPLEIVGGPGTAPGRFANPWSMAFDRAGNLYVADAGNHRVQKLVRRPVAEASGAAARAARVLRTRGEVPG